MKKLIIGVVSGSLITFLLLLLLCYPRNAKTICSKKIIFDSKEYTDLYPDTMNRCDYVILKRTKQKLYGWIGENKEKDIAKRRALGLVSEPVDTNMAINMIQLYNEKYNVNLNSTSFIDFERGQVMKYLIDVLQLVKGDKRNILRIYLASRGTEDNDSTSTIITAVSDDNEISFIGDGELKALDWGGLRPPPKSYKQINDDHRGTFLLRAINRSRNKPIITGRTIQAEEK